jgi:hypothetical protein
VNILWTSSKVGVSSVSDLHRHSTHSDASFSLAIRKDNTTLVFKVDDSVEQEPGTRKHIVYEVNRVTKQVLSKIELTSVFGMILGPNNEVILGIRQSKDSGLVQCYMKK